MVGVTRPIEVDDHRQHARYLQNSTLDSWRLSSPWFAKQLAIEREAFAVCTLKKNDVPSNRTLPQDRSTFEEFVEEKLAGPLRKLSPLGVGGVGLFAKVYAGEDLK